LSAKQRKLLVGFVQEILRPLTTSSFVVHVILMMFMLPYDI